MHSGKFSCPSYLCYAAHHNLVGRAVIPPFLTGFEHRIQGANSGRGIWKLSSAPTAKGFEALPKRWIVERTFGWLGRCRRLATDFENLSRMALAFLRLVLILVLLRGIAGHQKT